MNGNWPKVLCSHLWFAATIVIYDCQVTLNNVTAMILGCYSLHQTHQNVLEAPNVQYGRIPVTE